ncbi:MULTISPECIES: STAS domain-containing protein [unclassified Streptomyces]|uniref:STAS domain-containing protein n=1 Tax=unclassified Streptomyces TaxID=2593676 RepID=UPI0033B05DDA
MTGHPPAEFALHVVHEPPSLYVRVSGELDYDTGDDLVAAVTGILSDDAEPLDEVRLDFGTLTHIDASGLAALLLVHRRAGARGAALYLDNRPDVLERMLHVTNVLDHLTGPAETAPGSDEDREDGEVTGTGSSV